MDCRGEQRSSISGLCLQISDRIHRSGADNERQLQQDGDGEADQEPVEVSSTAVQGAATTKEVEPTEVSAQV